MKEFWTANRTIYPSIFRILIGFVLLIDLVFTVPAGSFLFDSSLNASLPTQSFYGFIIEYWQIWVGFYALILIGFIGGIGKNFLSFFVFLMHWIWLDMTAPLLTWGDTILKFSLMYFVVVDSFKYFSISKSNSTHYISTLGIWSIIMHLFLVYLNNAYFKIIDSDWQSGRALFYSFSQYPSFENQYIETDYFQCHHWEIFRILHHSATNEFCSIGNLEENKKICNSTFGSDSFNDVDSIRIMEI